MRIFHLPIRLLVPLYLDGDSALGWIGAHAKYPRRPGGRTTEADNMSYALRDWCSTVIPLDVGDERATRTGVGVASRHLEDLLPEQVTPRDMRACLEHMIATKCRDQVNNRKNRLLRFFRWCVEYEICTSAVITRLECVASIGATHPGVRETDEVTSVPDEHVRLTMEASRPELRRAIEIQALTGMRPGELLLMRVCDLRAERIPDDAGEHHIVWNYRPHWHKTKGKVKRFQRIIPLGPEGQMILREQVEARFAQPELFERHGTAVGLGGLPRLGDPNDSRRLWPWQTVGGYRSVIGKAARRAGVPEWAPNRLRHSRLTFAARRGGVKLAAAVAGHTDEKTTQANYIDFDNQAAGLFAQEHG